MQKTKLHYLKQMWFYLFGKSDFSMKQHKVCIFKWALSEIAIFNLCLVFSCTVTNDVLVPAHSYSYLSSLFPKLHALLLPPLSQMCPTLTPIATQPKFPDLHTLQLQLTQMMFPLPIFTPSYRNLPKWCVHSISSQIPTETFPNDVSAPDVHTSAPNLRKSYSNLPK